MARTHLFDRIRRAFLLADRANVDAVPTHRILERREEALSRRALLHGAAAVAGGLAATRTLTACSVDGTPEGTRSNIDPLNGGPRVVIVGAGLAGLTCAYRLGQQGIAASVYDANDRVGGRTFTLRSNAFSSKVELGGELIDTGHTQIRALAEELGLTVLDQATPVAALEHERYFIGGRRYTEPQIVEMFRPVASALRAEWNALGANPYATYSDYTPRARTLDFLSIAEWFERRDISGPIRTLLDVGYTSEYGLEIGQQSFLNLLYLIELEPDPFLIFGDSDEKFTIGEGNDAIATKIAATLRTPVALQHRLVAVQQRADGALVVTFERGGSSVSVVADKLVLALPFNQLRKCDLRTLSLGKAKRLSLANLRYGTNAKVMVGTSSRPWVAAGSSGTTFNDAVYHESWDSSRGYPGPGGVLTNFSGGNFGVAMGVGTALDQGKRFLDRMELVFPGVRWTFTGSAVRMHWPTAKFFEGSYACYRPGDWTSFVGSEGEVEGNVHFCGEHTSLDFQGYMEGAVESGERVAQELQLALGLAA